jgi:hypothetical protein
MSQYYKFQVYFNDVSYSSQLNYVIYIIKTKHINLFQINCSIFKLKILHSLIILQI